MDNEKDNNNYKSPIYPFYYNRKDPRVLVPKLIGYGYSLNFRHWAAWVIILLLVVAPLVVVCFIK